jgi:hypothetical protein
MLVIRGCFCDLRTILIFISYISINHPCKVIIEHDDPTTNYLTCSDKESTTTTVKNVLQEALNILNFQQNLSLKHIKEKFHNV